MTKYCLSSLSEIDPILLRSSRVLVATDFDGTLCPIANHPAYVYPSPATLEVLRRMESCSRITLAVISGRALADLSTRLPVRAVLAGNHGLEIQGGGIEFEHPAARAMRPSLAELCADLVSVVARWPRAWVEDKTLSATVHYRALETRSVSSLLLAVRRAAARFGARFALRAGSKALEIRPKVSWEKGSALNFIREQLGPFDATLVIGDDRSDETMFLAGDAISVRVGNLRTTSASYHLADPAEVAFYLGHVLDFCHADPPLRANVA
jgi:trehalose 6-phosphate phosphatase